MMAGIPKDVCRLSLERIFNSISARVLNVNHSLRYNLCTYRDKIFGSKFHMSELLVLRIISLLLYLLMIYYKMCRVALLEFTLINYLLMT